MPHRGRYPTNVTDSNPTPKRKGEIELIGLFSG